MFSPIRTPEPESSSKPHAGIKRRTNTPMSRKPDPDSLHSPVNVHSLSVQRFRDMVASPAGNIEQRDAVLSAGLAQLNKAHSTHHQTPSSSAARANGPEFLSPMMRKHQQQHRERQQQPQNLVSPVRSEQGVRHQNDNSLLLASDLSALLGGAPVPRLFAQAMQPRHLAAHEQEEAQQSSPAAAATASPAVRRPAKSNKPSAEEASVALSQRHARFIDDELQRKLDHGRKLSAQKRDEEEVTLPVAFHCRELGHQMADKLGPGSPFGAVLHRVVDLLTQFGQQQQEAAHRSQHALEAAKSRMREIEEAAAAAATTNGNDGENDEQKNQQQQQPTAFSPLSSAAADDDFLNNADPSNAEALEAERKRLVALVVQKDGELAAEHERLEALGAANRDLKRQLDEQFEAQAKRDDETRALSRAAMERHDALERAYQARGAEIADLKQQIKGLDKDLEERLWVSTIEVESIAVREAMLRKHCKDTESRCAVSAMRLRQEQEVVVKLRKKLADVVENIDEVLEEYLDGTVPAAQPQTPRPDKESVVKQIPSLGKAQVQSSTASIVDALTSLVTSLQSRLQVEERSWTQAMEEADRMLEERRGRQFESVEVQTEAEAPSSPPGLPK